VTDPWALVEQAFFDGAWDAQKSTRPRFGIKKTGGSRMGDAADFDPVLGAYAAGVAAPYVGRKLSQGINRIGNPIERAMGRGFAERKPATSRIGKLLQAPAKAGRGGGASRKAASRGRPGAAHGRPMSRPVSQLGGVRRAPHGSFMLTSGQRRARA
jgi:hypothetical protein